MRGSIDAATFEARQAQIIGERAGLEELIGQLQAQLDRDPQAVIAEAEAFLRRTQGKYETIAERRQVIEALQVYVVYRSLQQQRVFFSLPSLDADDRREFEWRGIESIAEIDWDDEPETVEFKFNWNGIR